MKLKRPPKHMGTGIYVHQQFSPAQLVKGDTFFDADFGDMVWNGGEWVSEDSNMYELKDASDVWPGCVIYIEKTNTIMSITKNTAKYQRWIPVSSVRYLLDIGFSRIYKFVV